MMNASYNGTNTTTLFDGTKTLFGALYNSTNLNTGSGTVTAGSNFAVVDITFDVAGVATNGTTTYNNTATATGTAFDGTSVTDNSDNGTAVESGTANFKADDAGEGDATPVKFGSTVSGTVWNDINNSANNTLSNIFTAGETGTNAGGLNAILVDPITNLVIASVAVAANGTYSFTNIPSFANLQVILSTTAGTAGSAPPAAALPAGWSATSPISTNTTGDINTGTYNSADAVRFGATDDSNNDFGIQRRPESAFNLQTSSGNPGGFNSATVTAGAFQTNNVGVTPNTQDYDGGTVNNIRITAFPANANSITINGTIYTNGGTCPPAASCTPWPGGGVTIPYTNGTGPSQVIAVDPVEGNVDVVIPFTAIDNAGKEDLSPGSVTIPFRTITLSGTVWDDLDGNLSLNGVETVVNGTNAGGGVLTGAILYANLVDLAGKIIATVPVASNGTYNFPNVPQNTSGLTVQLSTNQGTVGLNKPATAVSAGWYNTGENKNSQGGPADGTANVEITVNTATANITQQDFGIQQRPESAINLQPAQPNVNGFVNVTVPAAAFQTNNVGVTPNTQDYNGGTVSNIRITAFPSNTNTITINGTVYINGGTCPPATTCITWPGGGVTVPYTNGVGIAVPILLDPAMNSTFNVVIPFAAVDNAGAEDLTPGSVTIPFTSTLPVTLVRFTGQLEGNTAKLSWKTANEQNLQRFEIEWSPDGIHWQLAGTAAAIANSGSGADYNSLQPVVNGVNYFRLKMVDIDTRFSYSNVLRLSKGAAGQDLVIYPNPARDYIALQLPAAGTASIRITDVAGNTVYRTTATGNVATISVKLLGAGLYLVQVTQDGSTRTSRFVKE